MTKQVKSARKARRDRPVVIQVTPDVIEAVTEELIECGRLRDTYFREPDRDRVRSLAQELLSIAAVASEAGYEIAVAHLKDE